VISFTFQSLYARAHLVGGWLAQETVRAIWRREISRAAVGDGTPDSPSDYATLFHLGRVVGLVVLEQENAAG